jgi:hypothetical protein
MNMKKFWAGYSPLVGLIIAIAVVGGGIVLLVVMNT